MPKVIEIRALGWFPKREPAETNGFWFPRSSKSEHLAGLLKRRPAEANRFWCPNVEVFLGTNVKLSEFICGCVSGLAELLPAAAPMGLTRNHISGSHWHP